MKQQNPNQFPSQHSMSSFSYYSPAAAPSGEAATSITQSPPKKKRNLPGNPDPDAEVIGLSPKSLMATNRFICEICKKGFQRDQNLQLHKRGHNLPWKLKSSSNEVKRKKVYICPVLTCVHHHPSRALGDLTGIKKHFCRKHGEKKWKCTKCSKRYAVQSDWKAHSKICGTKEYKCDCGTIFVRRDSFITHRAFCDALVEDGSRSNPNPNPNPHMLNAQYMFVKAESQENNSSGLNLVPAYQFPVFNDDYYQSQAQNPNPSYGGGSGAYENPNPNLNPSAAVLLQKVAAQMGSTVQGGHVPVSLNSLSRDQVLSSFGDFPAVPPPSSSFFQEMMMMTNSTGFGEDEDHAFGSYEEEEEEDTMFNYKKTTTQDCFNSPLIVGNYEIERNNGGMTRDFFGTESFLKQ